jgi:hypothetical protein
MSWVIAPRKLTVSSLLDLEDVNDIFSAFGDELCGNLNEHNWSDGAFNDIWLAGKAAASFAITAYSEVQRVDPHAAVGSLTEIPQGTRWVAVPGTEQTIKSQGGKALLIYSFQATLNVGTGAYSQSGLNFCIEVDGVPMLEALLGGGDLSNDALDRGFNVVASGGSGSGFTISYGGSPSFRASQVPLLAKCVANFSPGYHTIRLLARNLFTTRDVYQYISSFELIALDMWA